MNMNNPFFDFKICISTIRKLKLLVTFMEEISYEGSNGHSRILWF